MTSRSNSKLALSLAAIATGMVMLAYAAVPLYSLFCQVTGYAGTPRIAKAFPTTVDKRTVTIRFNADTDPNLGWDFKPEQRTLTAHVGQSMLAFYKATNNEAGPTLATAVYNVTPNKAAPYFNKVECFCFKQQSLNAGQKADFPVSFFLDPAMLTDPDMKDVDTITLSYTFFPVNTSNNNPLPGSKKNGS